MSCNEAATVNVFAAVSLIFTNCAVTLYQFRAVSFEVAGVAAGVISVMLPVVNRCCSRKLYVSAGCAVDCRITVMIDCGLLSAIPSVGVLTNPICVLRLFEVG